MNPVLTAMNRLLPDYVRSEYPELFGWDFKIYDSQLPHEDSEVLTLVGRNSMTNETYRNSFTFSRRHLTQVGNLSDVYNEGFKKMMYEMHHEIIRKEADSTAGIDEGLMKALNNLL